MFPCHEAAAATSLADGNCTNELEREICTSGRDPTSKKTYFQSKKKTQPYMTHQGGLGQVGVWFGGGPGLGGLGGGGLGGSSPGNKWGRSRWRGGPGEEASGRPGFHKMSREPKCVL